MAYYFCLFFPEGVKVQTTCKSHDELEERLTITYFVTESIDDVGLVVTFVVTKLVNVSLSKPIMENIVNHYRKLRKALYCRWLGLQFDQPCTSDVKYNLMVLII